MSWPYYWKSRERRQSGEDKREFSEQLKRDCEEFDRRVKKKLKQHR
jgi:hypothetical protein